MCISLHLCVFVCIYVYLRVSVCICVYLGLQCPHHNNPADFIVDKIIDHEQEEDIAHGKIIVVASCDPR